MHDVKPFANASHYYSAAQPQAASDVGIIKFVNIIAVLFSRCVQPNRERYYSNDNKPGLCWMR